MDNKTEENRLAYKACTSLNLRQKYKMCYAGYTCKVKIDFLAKIPMKEFTWYAMIYSHYKTYDLQQKSTWNAIVSEGEVTAYFAYASTRVHHSRSSTRLRLSRSRKNACYTKRFFLQFCLIFRLRRSACKRIASVKKMSSIAAIVGCKK